MTMAAPVRTLAPGNAFQTTQSMQAPQTIDRYSNGATVAAGARRKASVTRCWAAHPARPRTAMRGQSAGAIATHSGAANAPAPAASNSRNQNTIDAVFSVAASSRTITTTIAQQSAEPSAARPATATNPDAAGLSATRTPQRPTRIAAQTCRSARSPRSSTAQGTTSSGADSVIA